MSKAAAKMPMAKFIVALGDPFCGCWVRMITNVEVFVPSGRVRDFVIRSERRIVVAI